MNNDQEKKTLDLFGQQPFGTHPAEMARRTDPDTSQEAAGKIDAAHMERMVYEVICMYPNGCTLDQIVKHFPTRGQQSISPRLAPLMRKGYICDSGERRMGSAGRKQRVLKKVEA